MDPVAREDLEFLRGQLSALLARERADRADGWEFRADDLARKITNIDRELQWPHSGNADIRPFGEGGTP